jgi:hypothetical protein
MASAPYNLTTTDDVVAARWPLLNIDLLVEELAAGLRPVSEIWGEHGITLTADAEDILGLPEVNTRLAEAQARWAAPSNASERIKVKARMAVEKSIVTLHGSVNNTLLPLNHRTEALKLMARLANVDGMGAGGGAGGAGGGVGVSIVIDLSRGGGVAGGEVIDAAQVRVTAPSDASA